MRLRIAAFMMMADLFADRIQAHQDGPRALANVLEVIEICAAVAEAQRAGAVEALRAQE